MDIAAMSMVMNQSRVQEQASLSMMKMVIGNAEQQGEAVQKLLSTGGLNASQEAGHPYLGTNVDIKG
ncbi:YjfB family protein [Virgibacillus halophilus]|uniref:YjfB family protein n=1 Tax=Tigheibacillus halophilus TaxID=361280 RepID=A0ABU5C8V0_9BACI|nr:YjfB family protein [Virgibacillus halophilus]